MRWLRLLFALAGAKFRRNLSVTGTSIIPFRVWITDIDVSIMNHAAILTVMEAGRIDLMVRTGFYQLARRKKWYFVSAAVHAQFMRPLKVFQKAELHTKLFHVDPEWIYIEQKIVRGGKNIANCIVKSKVKQGRENISTEVVFKELGSPFLSDKTEIINQYESVNELLYQRLFE
jgi:acyl-CoA thioesterase FadM